jgi:hypothetical protein
LKNLFYKNPHTSPTICKLNWITLHKPFLLISNLHISFYEKPCYHLTMRGEGGRMLSFPPHWSSHCIHKGRLSPDACLSSALPLGPYPTHKNLYSDLPTYDVKTWWLSIPLVICTPMEKVVACRHQMGHTLSSILRGSHVLPSFNLCAFFFLPHLHQLQHVDCECFQLSYFLL